MRDPEAVRRRLLIHELPLGWKTLYIEMVLILVKYHRLSGTGDSQRDSHIFIARQADSHESLKFPM